MAATMAEGSRVFLQGDVPEVVRWMRDMFNRHGEDRFSLAPECQGASNLIRDEWVTPFNDDDAAAGSGSDNSHDENEKGAPPRKRLRTAHEIEPLQQARNPLTWSADTTAGYLPENPLGVATEREVYV